MPTESRLGIKLYKILFLIMVCAGVGYWQWQDYRKLDGLANANEEAIRRLQEAESDAQAKAGTLQRLEDTVHRMEAEMDGQRQLLRWQGKDAHMGQYVNEGFALSAMAKTAVAEYHANTGNYPADNAQAGLPAPGDIRGDAVAGVAVGKGGVITVSFNRLLGKNKTLVLTPGGEGAGPLVWKCKSAGLPAQYLPPHCQ